jgi:hypothetical protein
MIAVAAVPLPLLPLSRWSGAPDQGPVWSPHLESWALGVVVVGTLAIIAGRLATRMPDWRLPRVPVADRWLVAALAVLSVVGAAVVSSLLFARNPQLIDEMAQLLHARALAAGQVALQPPEPPQAFLIAQTWVTDAGWVSQYPPGHTVLLAFGLLARAAWLVNPVLSGVTLVLVYVVARRWYGRRVARVAAFLWLIAAWVLFMSASFVNHVPAATLSLAAMACAVGPRRPGRVSWVGVGLFLVWAAATRPLDGVAAAVPIAAWLAVTRAWRAVPWIVVGGVPVVLAWAGFNWAAYGNPVVLGYSLLYGPAHGLGFHVDPWDQMYTPFIALSNVAMAIRRLHIYLFEWPIPALLPLALWAAFGRQRTKADMILAIGLMTAPLLYALYWHSGFLRGPRFYFVIVPYLVIGTARAWRWLVTLAGARGGRVIRWRPAIATAALLVLVWGWIDVLPARFDQYRTEFPTLKRHPERELRERGVGQALVLVRTSWGNRIVSDLWTLGVMPGLAERAYRRVDACDLDRLRHQARTTGMSAEALSAELEALIVRAVVAAPRVPDWPDPSLRLQPGRALPEECRREIARDLSGLTVYEHLAWRNAEGLDAGIVFARDLFERNEALLTRYPEWPVWRYGPAENGAPPQLTRVPGPGT